MHRFFIALFFVLFSLGSFAVTPYPEGGALFDVNSSQCAVGRPLMDVLNDLMASSYYFKNTNDSLSITTGSGNQKNYHRQDINGSQLEWPANSASDTVIYTSAHCLVNSLHGGAGDTLINFGLVFTASASPSQRVVKKMWNCCAVYSHIDSSRVIPGMTYNYTNRYISTSESVGEKADRNFINNLAFADECPKPNSVYEVPSDFYSSIAAKTGVDKVFVQTTRSFTKSIGYITAYIDEEKRYVGEAYYCPVVEEVYDTLCRGDLPCVYGTSLTQSGSDTTATKTWYGADSTFILHLVVNEPSESSFDSVSYSHTVVDTVHKQLREVYVNAAGCDSVVICNLTIIPKERDSLAEVIPAKFFTPNGDGINDTWTIQNLGLYKNYIVRIYDRHGKELMRYKGNFKEWDGVYNGNPQPSSDYWYTISIDESDTELYGHFTLIR